MKKIAYLGMDVHAANCVLGHMDFDGTFIGNRTFPTSEKNIIAALKAVKAKEKYLALEESTLAYWAAQVAKPYVTELISSDLRRANHEKTKAPAPKRKIVKTCCSRGSILVKARLTVSDSEVKMKVILFDIF